MRRHSLWLRLAMCWLALTLVLPLWTAHDPVQAADFADPTMRSLWERYDLPVSSHTATNRS